MFSKIDKIVKINYYGNLKKLRPIDCMDIANIIGQNVRVRINANNPLLKVCE
jgi:ribonucleoside-diphosphate reductase alpha chain/ribonucleoside-triphosphate reductase